MNLSTASSSDILLPILRNAGAIMLGAHDIEAGHTVHTKSGTANYVTDFDLAVQRYLFQSIGAAYPDAVFFAEEDLPETAGGKNPALVQSDRCFIIDPIDGTTNFIHGYKTSVISVAMLQKGEVVFAAIYHPYLGELYSAEKGKGAFCNGEPIHASSRPLDLALTAFGTCPYHKDTLSDCTFELAKELFLKTADVRRTGSAAFELAGVAAGRNDIFFEFILSPWDFAAGSLLIREAGGIVTDLYGNSLDFSHPSSVLAANPEIYPALLALVKKYRP